MTSEAYLQHSHPHVPLKKHQRHTDLYRQLPRKLSRLPSTPKTPISYPYTQIVSTVPVAPHGLMLPEGAESPHSSTWARNASTTSSLTFSPATEESPLVETPLDIGCSYEGEDDFRNLPPVPKTPVRVRYTAFSTTMPKLCRRPLGLLHPPRQTRPPTKLARQTLPHLYLVDRPLLGVRKSFVESGQVV